MKTSSDESLDRLRPPLRHYSFLPSDTNSQTFLLLSFFFNAFLAFLTLAPISQLPINDKVSSNESFDVLLRYDEGEDTSVLSCFVSNLF